jgi:hypothetical protein
MYTSYASNAIKAKKLIGHNKLSEQIIKKCILPKNKGKQRKVSLSKIITLPTPKSEIALCAMQQNPNKRAEHKNSEFHCTCRESTLKKYVLPERISLYL